MTTPEPTAPAAPLLGEEQMKIRQRIDDEITATIRNYGGGLRGSEDHWDMLTEALVDAALTLVAEQRKAEREKVADEIEARADEMDATPFAAGVDWTARFVRRSS